MVSSSSDAPRRVTLVLSDLQGSTALAERLDAETLRAVLTRYFAEMRTVLEGRGGVVAKIIGDAIVTVFEDPDDPAAAARRAAAAVLEARTALEWLNDWFDATWAVRLVHRTGVASGELWMGGESPAADGVGDVLAGQVMEMAESLEAAALGMEALLDAPTRRLLGPSAMLESAGAIPAKGKPTRVATWRLLGLRDPIDAPAAHLGDGPPWTCPSCGVEQRGDTRRCRSCGSPAAGVDVPRETRRTVTIVFADPRPASTNRTPLAPEVVRSVMSHYAEVVRPILEAHGGTVEKFIGDALMAVFGLPVRHEDDAVRAVRAAAEVQAAVGRLNEELAATVGARLAHPMGVNTGTVVAGDARDGERLVTGDAVNVAARLEQTAAAGEVVLGDLTRRLVGDAAEVEAMAPLVLKGKAEPVPAHRLVRVAGTGSATRRHDLPLVGRDVELDRLRAAFATARADRRATRITLIGDAGVGKSRLTLAFLDEVGRTARILRGTCVAYGDGMTFWPLAGVVQDAAGIAEGDDAASARAGIAALAPDEPEVVGRLQAVAGLGEVPFAVPELVWGVRRLLERLAASSPVVVLLDDVHWAEPTLLEAVEDLARSVQGPVTLLCSARPSVLEQHRAFVDGAECIALHPLTDAQCEQFLRHLLADADAEVDAGGLARVVEAAGGNPLFLEQLLSMLIDDGRLVSDGSRWRIEGDLATLELPASIEALLTARLDRLGQDERDVIEPASVIGRRFPLVAVTELVPPHLRPGIGTLLQLLEARELVVPETDDEPAHHFGHQLIRDATYGGLLKQVRARLHERYVRWGDARDQGRERSTDVDEVQGYHLEQAHRYWRELGKLDPHAISVGIDAARRLTGAGERALARGDMSAAANLLVRAADVLPDEHVARARALLLAGNALHETGAFDRAIDAYEQSAEAAEAVGAIAAAEAARLERLRIEYLIGRAEDVGQVSAAVSAALERLVPLDDPDALSRAWQLRMNVDIAGCQWEDAREAAHQVIDAARRAGNGVLEVRTMPLLAFLVQKGPMPVPAAVAACEEILRRVAFDRRSHSLTRLELATLSAMALDLDAARRTYGDTRHVLVELGWEMQAALVSLSSGPIELGADEPARAEAELRRDMEALDRMGERNFISLTMALLAEAVYRQGRLAEAADLVAASRELAAPDDVAVQIVVGCTSGKLACRRGDVDAGVAEVREAVRLIGETEDPSGQGDAWLDLAEALHLAGARDEAATAVERARDRHRAKGNLLGVRRAERAAAERNRPAG